MLNLFFCSSLSVSFQPVGLSDREVISRLRNCLLALAAHKVLLYDTSVLYCYESSVQHQVGSISSFNSASFLFLITPIASQVESNGNEKWVFPGDIMSSSGSNGIMYQQLISVFNFNPALSRNVKQTWLISLI